MIYQECWVLLNLIFFPGWISTNVTNDPCGRSEVAMVRDFRNNLGDGGGGGKRRGG